MNYITLSKNNEHLNEWTLTDEQQTTQTFKGDLVALSTYLKEQPLAGGCLTTDDFVTIDHKYQPISQYLTETTNKPFVVGTITDIATKVVQIPWTVDYYGFQPGKDEYAVESLLTVGNGFVGVRGTTPEMTISDETYPGTYIASLYNTAYSAVGDKTLANEDFVNAPNLQKMTIVVDDETVDITHNEIVSMHRQLNVKTGLFTANVHLRFQSGKEVQLTTEKIANMAQPSLIHLAYTIKPLNFSGEVTFVTEANGDVYNYNVARYRSLTQKHLDILALDVEKTKSCLVAQTKASHIRIVQQAELFSDDLDLTTITNTKTANKIIQQLTFNAVENKAYRIEKTIAVQKNSEQMTLDEQTLPRFNVGYQQSQKAWDKLWQQATIQVEGDLMSQKMLNLHTFHLLASASPNGNQTLDASVTARGLHGEAYRGHIFWDELFILPFYIVHFPETAKELLMYRYRRLAAAKENATQAGYQGAMFPWQSGLDGSEQSQELHLNPISGEWKEDHSRLQRHVSLAIAYNVWQYYLNTNDETFMQDYGLELLLEIAHFWHSTAEWDETRQRFNIDRVMGPDEFHEGYPNAAKGGLKNNTYTNLMVAWLFKEITQLHASMPHDVWQKVQVKTGMTHEEIAQLATIAEQLFIEINQDGVLAQFEGYFDLADLNWAHYRETYPNIYRMDRILNAEGKSADMYQVAKQADSLMIFYNFSQAHVTELLTDLQYTLPEDYVAKNLAYYLARTSHGSTLSRIVHAQLAAMINDKTLAWQLYQEALYSDYRDIQGGTTAEGIHAGVMAATLFIPLTTFSGLDMRQKELHFNPQLPEQWQSLAYHMHLRGVQFTIHVTHETIALTTDKDITVIVNAQPVALKAQQTQTIKYN